MHLLDKLIYRKSFFILIGGRKKINQIVDHFYQIMDSDIEAKECRDLHQKDLTEAKMKLRLFLYGWTGGPQTFTKKFGHPMLRKRHFPFKIGDKETRQWLYCMEKALSLSEVPVEVIEQMMGAFTPLAHRIKNQPN